MFLPAILMAWLHGHLPLPRHLRITGHLIQELWLILTLEESELPICQREFQWLFLRKDGIFSEAEFPLILIVMIISCTSTESGMSGGAIADRIPPLLCFHAIKIVFSTLQLPGITRFWQEKRM